jgi:hypothetical protein
MKIQKFIIYYHKPKWIVRFKSGKSTLFIESDGELIDDPGGTNTVLFKKGELLPSFIKAAAQLCF